MTLAGIVRRIDDLGRVVIPKEIRRTLRIREGDPLEIFTDRQGEVILKKYSPIGELGTFAKEYAEALAQGTNHVICICDKDQMIAAAGGMKKETVGKNISEELETIISDRRNVIISRAEGYVKLTQNDQEEGSGQVIWPIISEGDAIGAVVLIGREGRSMGETEKILAKCAAGFMGRQMES